MKFIKFFEDISIKDVPEVGGKNASLGEMIQRLSPKGIRIPDGFAVKSNAYWFFLDSNGIRDTIKKTLSKLKDHRDIEQLEKVGASIRKIIEKGIFPKDLAKEISDAYEILSKKYKQKFSDVAVRSSATAEDLPGASFAGQQETFLNISGKKELLEACRSCMASLFTNRAIVYRIEKGFDHFNVALSVCVQKMVRSDLASAGVMFSIDTRTGSDKVVLIESSYGLGEVVVKGEVTPDEFRVYKAKLKNGYKPIIKKFCGSKEEKLVYTNNGKSDVKKISVVYADQRRFSISDEEVLELAHMGVKIDSYYSKLNKKWTPMDIEWAKDGDDGRLYIVQARPETVHAIKQKDAFVLKYKIKAQKKELEKLVLVEGQSIGKRIISGKACVIDDIKSGKNVKNGDIIVTNMTTPDWVPVMRKSAGIVTQRGGRTCHAAIVSRELGIPAIVGAIGAMEKIKNGQKITIDCSRGNVGFVYKSIVPYEKATFNVDKVPKVPVEIFVNVSDPESAFASSCLPVEGVGLTRTEFILANVVKVHPLALLYPEKVKDKKALASIDKLVEPYESREDFFISVLSQNIGYIAAMFYPRSVTVRLSDFKSNEYRNLIGGEFFEPEEENPMLGIRGASRYYNDLYKPAFALECAAIKKVREEMGFENVRLLVPFVRTINEAKRVIELMKELGLERKKNKLEIFFMAEIPSNALLIEEFCDLFDGVSIGSNDLTQLTLGLDRDSELVDAIFDERDSAVKKIMSMIIRGAKKKKTYVSICGQAPSDYPEIGDFLIKEGISSLSLNSGSVIPFMLRFKRRKR